MFGSRQYFAVIFLVVLLSACAIVDNPQPSDVPAPRAPNTATALPVVSSLPAPSPSRSAHVLGPEPTQFVTVTPVPGSTQIPTVSVSPLITVTEPIHALPVGEQYPAKFALDDTYIYWTGGPDAHLYRFPIAGGENVIVASSQFTQHDDGYLFSEQIIRSGDWLIYVDTRLNDTGIWTLYALNLKTNQNKVIMQETGTGAAWSPLPEYSVEGDWLAWSRLELGARAACDQSILGMTNLATDEERELDRVCTADHYMWIAPLLSGNRIIVEQDLPDNQGRQNNIYLWDWTTGEHTALTTNGYSSVPAASGEWVVWKEAPRYDDSRDDVIYNLTTGLRQSIHVPDGCSSDPRVKGHWLYTTPCGGRLLAFDLERQQMFTIVKLPQGEKIDAVLVSDEWAVWSVKRNTVSGNQYEIQWRRLP